MLPVAILAGGLGSRLGSITKDVPKALIEICGEPFIFHQLRLLSRAGIRRVVICIGHLGDQIRSTIGQGLGFGLQIDYSIDGPALLGTAGAIKHALEKLDDQFFVMYGDSYLTCNFSDVQQCFENSNMDGLMTVFRNNGRFDMSNVEFVSGEIRRYDEVNRSHGMQHIDYGLGVFRASAFETVPGNTAVDLATVYQSLLASGRLGAYEVSERFYEIGSFEGIRDLETFLCPKIPV